MNHKLFFQAVALCAMLISGVALADYSGLTNQTLNNTAIVDNVGNGEYYHSSGKITGTSSLTLNATSAGGSGVSRQWLTSSSGYSFTGPIQINAGHLLVQKKLATKSVTVGQAGGIGGAFYAMCTNALSSGATITVKPGYFIDSESALNTLSGTTVNIENGGYWTICSHATDYTETQNTNMTLNIAGTGNNGNGAVVATSWGKQSKNHISVSGTINLTADATIGNRLDMSVNSSRMFVLWSNITGADTTTLTLKGASNSTIIRLDGNNSGFKGNMVVDTGKVYFNTANCTGSAKGLTVQNGGTAFLFQSNLLNGKTLTVKSGSNVSAEGNGINNGFNGAKIYLESGGGIMYWTGLTSGKSCTDNVNILSTGDGTTVSRYEKGGTGVAEIGGSINVTGPFQLQTKNAGWGNHFNINSKITGSGLLETNAVVGNSYVNLMVDSLSDFTGSIKTMGEGYTSFYGYLNNVESIECSGNSIIIFDKSSGDQVANNVSGTGSLWTAQTGGFTFNNTVDTTFTGAINTRRLNSSAPDGTITKTGSATLTIAPASGKNLWTNFVVSQGGLNLNGTMSGSIEVQDLAFVSPGTSTEPVGIMNVQSDFTLRDGGTLKIDVANFETKFDVLNVSGNATFEDGSILSVTLPYSASKLGESFAIDILNAGSVTGDLNLRSNDYSWRLSFDPTTGILSGVADPNYVPEPSTWALLILGGLGLMWLNRSEKREARKTEQDYHFFPTELTEIHRIIRK